MKFTNNEQVHFVINRDIHGSGMIKGAASNLGPSGFTWIIEVNQEDCSEGLMDGLEYDCIICPESYIHSKS